MASLKEIKGRIGSVKSTQKITSAMKMTASAKLRNAQSHCERFQPYEERLSGVLKQALASEVDDISSPLSAKREVERVAVVAFTSNSGLCGAFNSTILRLTTETIQSYLSRGCEVAVYPVGKKIEDAVKKAAWPVAVKGSYIALMDKPAYEGAAALADELMTDFRTGGIDRVELIYNHFKSVAVQRPVVEAFLPLTLPKPEEKPGAVNYIIEPDPQTLLDVLFPQSLRSKIYAVLLDSAVAEQASRTVAMQIATDNADKILEELNIQYNKQRQQSITSELLDIIGGSEALK